MKNVFLSSVCSGSSKVKLLKLKKPSLTIVIPAYNEEKRILSTLQRVQQYFNEQSYPWCVLMISDGSNDQTDSIYQNFSDSHSNFELISYKPNKGKGYAVRTGIMLANSEWVLFSDADLAAPVEEIEKLLPCLYQGYDVAIGSRSLKKSHLLIHQPLYREWMGKAANKFIQILGIKGIQDTQCGFKLFKKEAAHDIFCRCQMNGFSFDIESLMIANDLGYKIAEVPIRWAHQEGSKVKIIPHYLQSFKDLIWLRLQGKKRRLLIKTRPKDTFSKNNRHLEPVITKKNRAKSPT